MSRYYTLNDPQKETYAIEERAMEQEEIESLREENKKLKEELDDLINDFNVLNDAYIELKDLVGAKK